MNPPFGEPVARTKDYLKGAYPWLPKFEDLLAAFVGRGLELSPPAGGHVRCDYITCWALSYYLRKVEARGPPEQPDDCTGRPRLWRYGASNGRGGGLRTSTTGSRRVGVLHTTVEEIGLQPCLMPQQIADVDVMTNVCSPSSFWSLSRYEAHLSRTGCRVP